MHFINYYMIKKNDLFQHLHIQTFLRFVCLLLFFCVVPNMILSIQLWAQHNIAGRKKRFTNRLGSTPNIGHFLNAF